LTAAWISAVIAATAASSDGTSGRNTTTAVTASPHFSSGVPITHTWATEGCSATASSTSRPESLYVLADSIGELAARQSGVAEEQHWLVAVALQRACQQVTGVVGVAQQVVLHIHTSK
jgi:hypothetical protein